jgi:hypothetical protein
MVFECTYNLQALLVVASHNLMIIAFEAYNLSFLACFQVVSNRGCPFVAQVINTIGDLPITI